MAAFLFMWGLFTLFMFIATLRISRALQVVNESFGEEILPIGEIN